MTTRIALANQKGGVGKTTLTINLAAAFAARGYRVLVGDLDPQANTTSTLDPLMGDYTLAEVLDVDPTTREVAPGSAAAAVCPSGEAWPEKIDVLPGALALAVREQDSWDGREYRLARACDGVTDEYDVVLWDCPPSIGQLTVNALAAADNVWVVTDPTRFGVDGTALIMGTIDRAQRYHNPGLNLAGIVINKTDQRTTESAFRAEELRERYGPLVWHEDLPYIEVVRKAGGAAAPLTAYGSEGAAAGAGIDRLAAHMIGAE